MERKLNWKSGCFDEIELVYEKAEENESIRNTLSAMEQAALTEARACIHLLRTGGEPITAERFDQMSDVEQEQIIELLSRAGLASLSAPLTEPIITIKLSAMFPHITACTMFSILNRLEKLDGAYNFRFPKATLELQAPLGGRKGLMQYEMLIMQLYPWLSVKETATNEVAAQLPVASASTAGTNVTLQTEPAENLSADRPSVKRSLFSKLFRNKHS